MKPFCALKVGLTAGFQSRSQRSTPRCSAELNYQVYCGRRNRIGSQVWDWDWRNKYIVPRSHRAHLLKITHSNIPTTTLKIVYWRKRPWTWSTFFNIKYIFFFIHLWKILIAHHISLSNLPRRDQESNVRHCRYRSLVLVLLNCHSPQTSTWNTPIDRW